MSVFWTPGYEAAAAVPMTHSRILYAALAGTVTASLEAEGFAAVNATSPDTYSYWGTASAGESWVIDFGSGKLVDAVGIAAHELAGGTVSIDTWNGSAWVEKIVAEPTDNSALLLLFAAVTTAKVRVRVDDLAGILIGVIYAGSALQMELPAFASLGQIELKRQTEFRTTQSEGGQWLGRSIARTAIAASYSWSHISDAFYRAQVEPFSKQARLAPFFLAARPQGYAAEVAYGWVGADIQPSRMGVRNRVSFGFDVVGYSRD